MADTRPQSVAVVVVLALVCAPLVGGPVAADQQTAGPDTPPVQPRSGLVGATAGPGMHVTYVVSALPDDPGRVAVRAEFELSSAVTRVTATFPAAATHRSETGFEPVQNESSPTDLRWGGDDPTPTVSYRVDARLVAHGGVESVDTREWSFLSERAVGLADVNWWYRGPRPPSSRTFALAPGVDGVAGDDVALLGETTVSERQISGHTFRLVVADAAAAEPSQAATADQLASLAESFEGFGRSAERTTVFVPPARIRQGGLATVRHGPERELWVRGGPETLAHEFVHTRQSFRPVRGRNGPAMTWLLEGMGDYYASLHELRQGRLDYATFRQRTTTDKHADAVLTDESTWAGGAVAYAKGRRVVAALDAKLRVETGGQRSFRDVWRRMNAHEGRVSYADFCRMVSEVAEAGARDGGPSVESSPSPTAEPTDFDAWLDRYVRGDEAPSVPNRPFMLVVDQSADPDGDGRSNAAERRDGQHPFATGPAPVLAEEAAAVVTYLSFDDVSVAGGPSPSDGRMAGEEPVETAADTGQTSPTAASPDLALPSPSLGPESVTSAAVVSIIAAAIVCGLFGRRLVWQ
ncbi:hypothetical protein [Haloarchaeobius sp. DFWS5]|uniref:hypothetical protein n=1 Tax=Haloarchaeobius sp. DFWS5 TaxID=3446114 RepID=UPI003EBAD4B1